jgi:sugar porter (SP) family MFS transporter
LGGFLFGYDTAVVNGSIEYLVQDFDLSAGLEGWAASSALIGCIFGAMFAGMIGDRFGRKRAMLLCAALFTVSAVGSAIPQTLSFFVWARFIGGLGVGGASMLSPMYIAEISPEKIRGRLVSIYQLAIAAGILIAFLINMLIQRMGDQAWNTDMGWRWMFGSEIIPAIMFGVVLLVVPESPRWLMKIGRRSEAMAILAGIAGQAHAELEVAHISESLKHEEGKFSELFTSGFRMALIVGVFMAIFQQLCGIQVVMYYSTKIMKSVGSSTDAAFMSTVVMGVVMVVFTFVAIWLVDKVGRRILLIAGTTIQCVSLTIVGLLLHFGGDPYVVLLFLLIFVASFAAGMGPVMWIVVSEIFPTKVRGRAMSVTTLTLWAVCYAMTQTFPVLLEEMGGAGTFAIYAAGSLLSILFIAKFVPETKGRTLEEIEESWLKRAISKG